MSNVYTEPYQAEFDRELISQRVRRRMEQDRDREGVIASLDAPTGSLFYTQADLDSMKTVDRNSLMEDARFRYISGAPGL